MKDHIKSWRMLYLFIAVVVSVVVGFIYHTVGSFWPSGLGDAPYCDPFCVGDESEIRANLGALGDVVGGMINPILTFCSIVLLIHTIRLTQKTNTIAQEGVDATKAALDQSVEMLKLTEQQVANSVAEMELTRTELAGAKEAQQEMVKAQNLQKRNAAFFELFEHFSKLSAELNASNGFNLTGGKKPIADSLWMVIQYANEIGLRNTLDVDYKQKPYLMSFIKQLIMLYKLADGDSELEGVIETVLTLDMQTYCCYFSCYSTVAGSGFVKQLIKDKKVVFLDLSVLPSGCGSDEVYYSTLDKLDIPYIR